MPQSDNDPFYGAPRVKATVRRPELTQPIRPNLFPRWWAWVRVHVLRKGREPKLEDFPFGVSDYGRDASTKPVRMRE